MEKKIEPLLRVFLLLVLGWGFSTINALAFDTGWMQKGVRIWYIGGLGGGGGVTSPDAEEAYLINGIDGNQVSVSHHSAASSWSSPNPVTTLNYPLLGQGPCWVHPQLLQNLQVGQVWLGQEITWKERKSYTYDTFPYRLLPAWALFKLTPQRWFIKITYIMPDFISTGTAFFDEETGLLLCYTNLWGGYINFFILSEINYDFGARRAFPEDNGPHTGFKSFLTEAAYGAGTGLAIIQSLVQTRYGNTIEMRVMTSLTGPSGPGLINSTEEVCFFGDVPIVTHKDYSSAGNFPPEQWDLYGQHLWWWLPPAALSGNSINVLNVPMSRMTGVLPAEKISAIGNEASLNPLAAGPYIFSATGTSTSFYFSELRFGEDGYLTLFSAKDPRLGVDIQADHIFSGYKNELFGPTYYRDHMGTAAPINYTQAIFLPLITR